jgi:hypothetical protein
MDSSMGRAVVAAASSERQASANCGRQNWARTGVNAGKLGTKPRLSPCLIAEMEEKRRRRQPDAGGRESVIHWSGVPDGGLILQQKITALRKGESRRLVCEMASQPSRFSQPPHFFDIKPCINHFCLALDMKFVVHFCMRLARDGALAAAWPGGG